MDVETDIQAQSAETEAPVAVSDPLAESVEDPLAAAAPEASGEAVQMILPPKPGAGPKVGDAVVSVEEALAELAG